MRVLVCGGRDFGFRLRGNTLGTFGYIADSRRIASERALFDATMADYLNADVLIYGKARGADELAEMWARRHGIPALPFPANWYPNGRGGGLDRSAGPKRNARMIRDGRPDIVIAFPGGTGTADCVSQARSAGIKVVEGMG